MIERLPSSLRGQLTKPEIGAILTLRSFTAAGSPL
jgi:hypothetical protein